MKLRSILVLGVYGCVISSRLFGVESDSYDLRNVAGSSFVSAVKSQQGGTCWTHAAMAAIESNLMMTGNWVAGGESGEPDLAEYHLDWWNGFNKNNNADIAPRTGGLTVHEGGDYRVAAAYLALGGGAVRNRDGQSYSSAPAKNADSYRHYYVRDIEWFTVGTDLAKIDKINAIIRDHGVMGTALAWSSSFYSSGLNSFYQPTSSSAAPNHAVSIVGWDDARVTQASRPGAWLIKNSWGTSWGSSGYFWISYYDKVAGVHREMGAVSMQNVEPLQYSHIYSHDYHGWRATKTDAFEAFNAFTAAGSPSGVESLKSVSFYSVAEQVEYEISVYADFRDGNLEQLLSQKIGTLENTGFHTVDLDAEVDLVAGQKFYVALRLSHGGHAYDTTSDVPVLLGGTNTRVIVESFAGPGQSYYRTADGWVDLQSFDGMANFSIKGLSVTH